MAVTWLKNKWLGPRWTYWLMQSVQSIQSIQETEIVSFMNIIEHTKNELFTRNKSLWDNSLLLSHRKDSFKRIKLFTTTDLSTSEVVLESSGWTLEDVLPDTRSSVWAMDMWWCRDACRHKHILNDHRMRRATSLLAFVICTSIDSYSNTMVMGLISRKGMNW